ncbi:hypothetical protein RDV89_09100 [Nocardioides zeae]|uniref:Uncharacterized protein n=1 Tax=Nocardioides imazamoxiresistens TaxID=3231893 RepID=A0ABU3PVK0_9ACTN|nr:hypothetical protein [Nocardioides zeae]MDT9593224.1 hypothetical protein [Nocardioides zeae]
MSHVAAPPPLPALPPRPGAPLGEEPTASRRGWITVVLSALAVLLVGGVLVAVAGFGAGSSSPEEAVEDFLNGIAAEDGAATLAATSPGEVRGAVAFEEAMETRLAAFGAEVTDVGSIGLEYEIEGLELSSEAVGTDVSRVTVTAGTLRISTEDGSPISEVLTETFFGAIAYSGAYSGGGDAVVYDSEDEYGWYAYSDEDLPADVQSTEVEDVDPDWVTGWDDSGNVLDEESTSFDIDLADVLGSAVGLFSYDVDDEGNPIASPGVDTTFVVVRQDGDWYVSLLGTVADLATTLSEGPEPDFAALDAAVRAASSGDRTVGESPEEAVRLLVDGAGSGDVTALLDALPIDLVGGLYPFAEVLQELYDDGGVNLAVTELETTDEGGSGDVRHVRVDRLVLEGTVGGEDGSFELDGSCITSQGVEECLPAELVEATGIDGLVLTVVAVEGGYQVDPVATVYDNLTTALAAVPDAYLVDFLGVAEHGERETVGVGEHTVTPDAAGNVLLEVEAGEGQVVSVAVPAGVEVDDISFYAPGERFPDWSAAVYGTWEPERGEHPAVGAARVTAAGAQLVQLVVPAGEPVQVVVNVDDASALPLVADGEEVALQHGTYGLAAYADAREEGWSAGGVDGAGALTSCEDAGCLDVVVVAAPGVTVDFEAYADFEDDLPDDFSEFQYRDDSAYELDRAEAQIAGAGDEGWLDVELSTGSATAELTVTSAGWVLLDAINYDEEADIVLTLRDADGAVIVTGDANAEYGDEWADAELEPGTYTIEVTLYGDATSGGEVGLTIV